MEAALRNVIVTGRSFDLTRETRQYIHQRIGERISRFSRAIRSIEVRITDVNGPKGGEDKACSVIATLEDGQSLVATTRSTTVQRALTQAIRILGRRIATTLRRSRWQRPKGGG